MRKTMGPTQSIPSTGLHICQGSPFYFVLDLFLDFHFVSVLYCLWVYFYYGVGIPGVFDASVLIFRVEPTKLIQMYTKQIWGGFKYKMWVSKPMPYTIYQLPSEWLLLIINLMLWSLLVLLSFFSREKKISTKCSFSNS